MVAVGEEKFTLGVMVLTNMGNTRDLILGDRHIGPEINEKIKAQQKAAPREIPPQGPVIVIMATDLP